MEESQLSIAALQPEILNQIFHKLPIKPVLYCKLVCKQWRSLISDPLFKSTYINPSTTPINLVMIPSKPSAKLRASCYEIDTSGGDPLTRHPQPLPGGFSLHDRVAVLGSCNGLVGLYQDPGEFCLFNPCTGEAKTVHVDAMHEQWKMNWCADLLFGLCYDPISKAYKAVLSISSRGSCGFYVVSFNDGDWKLKTQPGLMEHPSYCANVELGAVVNGVPHWTSGDSVFLFDGYQEEFRMVRKPEEWGRRKICGLGGLDGKLSVAVSGDGLEIWVMKEYGNDKSWSNLFVVANAFRTVSILSRMKGEDEILMDVNQQELVVYNAGSQSMRKVQKKMWRTLYNIITYVPSFASPAS